MYSFFILRCVKSSPPSAFARGRSCLIVDCTGVAAVRGQRNRPHSHRWLLKLQKYAIFAGQTVVFLCFPHYKREQRRIIADKTTGMAAYADAKSHLRDFGADYRPCHRPTKVSSQAYEINFVSPRNQFRRLTKVAEVAFFAPQIYYFSPYPHVSQRYPPKKCALFVYFAGSI